MRIRMMQSAKFLFLLLVMLAAPVLVSAQVDVSITIAPPELPVYDQPVCPSDGYIWAPGYWAWDAGYGDYYWVPGTWVEAPEAGFFWTPGYWGWGGGGYVFNQGYWGPQVGFYGGIDYGFGYFGDGFVGGRWDGGHFFYNRAVSNVNVTVIHNVYDERVTNRTETRVSFNGGNGGVNARPTARDEAAAHERHVAPVAAQMQHVQAARADQQLRASVNHGKPPIAATAKPGGFHDQGAVAAREGGAVHSAPQPASNGGRPNNESRPANTEMRSSPNGANPPNEPNKAVHPKDLPPIERATPPNTGNPKVDQKYQQQQQQLATKQGQERQRLQQKQDQDHAKLAQQQAGAARQQQVEQKHAQQTQQLSQKHAQQQQQLQQRQQPSKQNPPPKGPPHKGPGEQS